MSKILVTGAGGFVGTYLIKELQKSQDFEVYGSVFKSTSDLPAQAGISFLLSSDHIFEGDLSDLEFARSLIQKTQPDIIFHLAALSVVGTSVDKAISVMNTNTTISYSVLEAVKAMVPTARFVAICSANEYGAVEDLSHPIRESTPLRPLNPYAVSKVTQEMLSTMYGLAYGLDIVILRPFNHTGIGQTTDFVIPNLASQFAQIEKGTIPPIIELGNLGTIRDFTDVRDMARAYVLAAGNCKSGEIYNIGSGEGHTISEIVSIFQSLSKVKVEIKTNPSLVRKADVPVLIADSSKFRTATGWKPTISLLETISDILNSYRR